MKKILVIFLFLTLTFTANIVKADIPHFIDFSKVLNQSTAGKKAQDFLKKKFASEKNRFKKTEESLKKEETQLISQKKIITSEEYSKKVEALRKKVSNLQNEKRKSINDIAKLRSQAKNQLLKALNPIIKKYMEDNKIRLVLDKKSILLGDQNLEITKQIIEILNKEVKSLKLN
jgi:outer membrane protein|tara:strand:+ start:734 stop:1255 length:522 start_codon:yes stop_codon:yes gene_type:complete